MQKALFVVTLALLIITSLSLWFTKDKSTTTLPQITEGKALIGGHFNLTDQNGHNLSDSDLRGKVMLVFFGFTRCPDICPVTVQSLSNAMQLLGEKAAQVVPVFITVDPAYDTAAVLKTYFVPFDSHFIGLTGSPEQIKQVASAYKAYFSETTLPEKDDDEDEHSDHDKHADHTHHAEVTVDHSGFIYAMGKDGNYLTHFPYNVPAQEIVDAIKPYLN